MKKFVAILASVLLPLGALHSEDITADYLKNRPEPWVCLEGRLDGDNITLALGKNEKNAILEMAKDKYYLISRADSIFVDGLNLRIDLISKNKACLLDREQAEEIKPMKNGKTNTTLPRPLALKREDGNNEWIFDLQKNAPNPPSGRRVVILREWPHACPACSLVFSMADNPSLTKDSIFVARGDNASYNYPNRKNALSLSYIKVTKNEKGHFVRIDKIKIDGQAPEIRYKTKNAQDKATKDAYSLDCYAEIVVARKIQDIKEIRVEYSYLDENLNEMQEFIQTTIEPTTIEPTTMEPPRLVDIFCYILFGLTALVSGALIWQLFRAPKEAPKSPGPDKEENDGPTPADPQPQANPAEQIPAAEPPQPQAAAEAQQQALLDQLKQEIDVLTQGNDALAQEKDALNQENEVLRKNNSEHQAKNNELQAKNNELQAKVADYKQKVNLLIEATQKAFGEMPEGAKLTDFITRKGEDFKELQNEQKKLASICTLLNSYFGNPEEDEDYEAIITGAYEKINLLNEQINDEKAKCQSELKRQKEAFKQEQQELLAAHQEDTRLYRDAQLALLDRMKAAYERCSGGAIPSSKFGKYVLRLSETLSSFINTAEPIFKEASDEDSIASLSEKFSPTLRKELNDNTSWLNALVGLEAYARTEVLRKPMLEDGLDLSSLTEFFYATQELLKSNFYTINPLPALFVDTVPGDDYIKDNMDSKISDLFDYEKILKTNAIVDIIKIGYSYKNNASTQTTINYYEKPAEV